MAHQIELNLNEIYKALCPKCQQKVRDLVKDKLTDQAIKETLEGKEK